MSDKENAIRDRREYMIAMTDGEEERQREARREQDHTHSVR